jgi:hypothetical protein
LPFIINTESHNDNKLNDIEREEGARLNFNVYLRSHRSYVGIAGHEQSLMCDLAVPQLRTFMA